MASYDIDTSGVSDLFKTVYGPLAEETFNTMFEPLGRVKKVDGFTGTQKVIAVPLSFGGSVGSGSLPTANPAEWDQAALTRKKVYGRLEIDRETIYAAKDDKGAFVRATKEFVRKVVESYTRNSMRILFGSGDGSLGVIASGGVSGSNPYVLTISDATWKEANFEENDYVNIETGNTDLFEVTAVDPANKQVTVNRITGSQVPVATDEIFMQGSEDNDPHGLKEVCDATAGSLYAIPVQRRWQAYQQAETTDITPDMLNEALMEMHRRTGRQPDLIVTSYKQFRKLTDQMEDQKRYSAPGAKKVGMGFNGVEVMGPKGPVPVIAERFVEDDRVYLLDTKCIEMHKAGGFGWFDDDGTVLLRSSTSDSYEARYGGYWNFLIKPTFQGVITGLT